MNRKFISATLILFFLGTTSSLIAEETWYEDQEKQAVLAFYSGNYQQAKKIFELILKDKPDSARIYFYLGCSNAALAFMVSKNEGQPLLARARENFAQSRSLNPSFRYDITNISPRILKIYAQAQ
jgi:hypothetical protein